MEFLKRFDSYKITYYSRWTHDALIQFASNGQLVGQITFVSEGDNIANYTNSAPDGFIDLYLRISKFNDIINILRLEKPLALFLQSDNGVGAIQTMEPIEEQE